MPQGKVYLVGAGPGHPGLLTLKAAELLRRADVVVYDRLIQEEVLAMAKPGAERLYMGKPLGRHDSRQDEIHDLLVRKAREGKLVVRLKGGDPFLFGRGGEEAEYLARHGVAFDVIPGVSSALAAPLAAGIAVTHREASSAVAFVTGHEAKKDHSFVDWAALAHIDTLVFLMGVSNTGVIARNLMDQGRSPETPVAMIQMAYWPQEQVVTGTLATIAGIVESAGIRPPATMVVGPVVRLREKLLNADRDLRRRADGAPEFDPAPQPDQLLRLALGGLASQLVRVALHLGLFDAIEEAAPADALADRFKLNRASLETVLDCLVSLGLIERTPAGYRNLELASCYLTVRSPRSLKPLLENLAALAGETESLWSYVRKGAAPPRADTEDELMEADGYEALARLAAPEVARRLERRSEGPALVLGWGGEAYRQALAGRWPGLVVTARNPLEPSPAGRAESWDGASYGLILLEGALCSSRRGKPEQVLERAAQALAPGGVLAIHDRLAPEANSLSPEIALEALGRHILGHSSDWSVTRLREFLGPLGLAEIRSELVWAGGVLVLAEKPRS